MEDRKLKLAICQPVGLDSMHPHNGSWLADLAAQVMGSGRFAPYSHLLTTQHRILDARNNLTHLATEGGADYILFLDADMWPDVEVPLNEGYSADGRPSPNPQARSFFWSSLTLLEDIYAGRVEGIPAGTPGVIGAPALSGPPEYKVNVFVPDEEKQMRRVTQREAMDKKVGFERVMAVGTGVMLIDARVFQRLEVPWFDDEYNDVKKTAVFSSQDIVFCMKCVKAGIPVFANWYSWARHYKVVGIDRPDEHLLAKLDADAARAKEANDLKEFANASRQAAEHSDSVPSAAAVVHEKETAGVGVPDTEITPHAGGTSRETWNGEARLRPGVPTAGAGVP